MCLKDCEILINMQTTCTISKMQAANSTSMNPQSFLLFEWLIQAFLHYKTNINFIIIFVKRNNMKHKCIVNSLIQTLFFK